MAAFFLRGDAAIRFNASELEGLQPKVVITDGSNLHPPRWRNCGLTRTTDCAFLM